MKSLVNAGGRLRATAGTIGVLLVMTCTVNAQDVETAAARHSSAFTFTEGVLLRTPPRSGPATADRWPAGAALLAQPGIPTGVSRMPRLPQPRASRPGSAAYRNTQRVLAGVAMGVVGFVAGATVGVALEQGCGCAAPQVAGMPVAAPIGAAAGAVLGVRLVR